MIPSNISGSLRIPNKNLHSAMTFPHTLFSKFPIQIIICPLFLLPDHFILSSASENGPNYWPPSLSLSTPHMCGKQLSIWFPEWHLTDVGA